jgi:hypothetical protein
MIRTEDGAIVGSINVNELTDDDRRALGLDVEGGEGDLSSLTKAELVERVEAAGGKTSGLNKAELVAILESTVAEVPTEGEES